MSERSTPRTRVISRDTITWLAGLGIMIYQGSGLAEPFNPTAFWGGIVVAGGPLVWQGVALITGRTAGPSSSSLGPPSSPESPTPSSSGVG